MREIEFVRSLPERARVGDPAASGPLALVPVFGGAPAPSYVLAADAITAGTLSIGETGGGEVPMLAVGNARDLPVLLVEGQHLEGAMQDPRVQRHRPPAAHVRDADPRFVRRVRLVARLAEA